MAAVPGQETLVACWSALAKLSPGAELIESASALVALFPSWGPLNNAIVLPPDEEEAAVSAAGEVSCLYADIAVETWALWIPSGMNDFDAADTVQVVDGLVRDTTTLVMHAPVPSGLRSHGSVVPASIAAIARIGEEPLAEADLGPLDEVGGLAGWAMLHEGVAVCGAWSYLNERDCGIYAVETLPAWRCRGLARALVEHVLADAVRRGAHTASLQSTPMAQALYESLGFVPAGRYEEWTPAPDGAH